MKININALIIASVDVVLLVIVTLISNMRETEWIETSFYLYIVSIVVNIIAIREIKKGYINYPMVMYVLLVLFHLSQIYLGYIGIEDYYCIFSRVKFESCQKAFTFAFVCIHVMMISFFLFYRAHEKKTETNTCVSISSVEKKLIKYVFFLFYFIKCIIRVYWFYIGTQIGYISLLRTMSSLPSMIITAADVFSIIYLRYCCKGKRRLNVLRFIIVLEVVYMASGSRIAGVTYILLLLLFVPFRVKETKKYSLGYKLAMFCGVLLMAFLLPAVSANRLSSSATSTFSMQYLKNSSVVNSIIKEFGMTILNTTVAIDNKQSIDFLHGLSYYGGLITLIPNINGFFDGFMEKCFYNNQLLNFFYYAYGGSNIGEAYINFGGYGWLVFIPVGVLMGKIEDILDMLQTRKLVIQLVIVTIVFECITWIRSYFFLIIRLPIWLAIFWLLIVALLKGGNRVVIQGKIKKKN